MPDQPDEPPDKPSTLNSQVNDAVATLNAIGAGQAPATAAAMLALVSANTIGLSLYNAVARQQTDAALGSASIVAACARMLGTQAAIGTGDISGDAPPSEALVAVAEAQAHAAIAVLKAQSVGGGRAPVEALARLAAELSSSPVALGPKNGPPR